MIEKLSQLQQKVLTGNKKCIAVASSADKHVLLSVKYALETNLIDVILFGPENDTRAILSEIGMQDFGIEIENVDEPKDACRAAVRAVKNGDAEMLMKGKVGTADLLKEVLNKDADLLKGSLLSHVGLFESPFYHKIFALTDAAMNITPSLEEKTSIVKNSVSLFHSLGVELPKVAILCAVETVNPKMTATMDAAALCKMQERGQIPDCIIDGPLAMDNAISAEAAADKGINSEVAGDADILIVPDINSGNMIYKTLSFLGNAQSAGVIMGAKVPIILTSRADSENSKFNSIMLAASAAGTR